MPVNEGMITVTAQDSKIESSGELFRLMKKHIGGRVIECSADTKELDVLCTEHDGEMFVSVVNRSAVPYRIDIKEHNVLNCTEIKNKNFSFFSNDYELNEVEDVVVDAYSILFFAMK